VRFFIVKKRQSQRRKEGHPPVSYRFNYGFGTARRFSLSPIKS